MVASLALLLTVPPLLERGARTTEHRIDRISVASTEAVSAIAVAVARPVAVEPGQSPEQSAARVRQRYRDVTAAVRELDALEGQIGPAAQAVVRELKHELSDWASLLAIAERHPESDVTLAAIREQRDNVARRLPELQSVVTRSRAALLRESDTLRNVRNAVMLLLAFAAFASVLVIGRIVERLRASRLESERERREKAALLESTADGVIGVDVNGRCQFMNPMAAAMLGTSPNLAIGREIGELFRVTQWAHLAGSEPLPVTFSPDAIGRFEVEIVRTDGERFTAECSRSSIIGDGQVRGAVLVFRDVTARKKGEHERLELFQREREARSRAEAAEHRAEFLAEASEIFAGSLDYETTLHSLVQLVVPRVADSCIIYLLDENGGIERLEPTHIDPEKEAELKEQLRRHPPRWESLIPPVASALRSGKSTLLSSIGSSSLKRNPADGGHVSIAERIGLDSLLVTPLRARDRIIGAISYGVSGSDRTFGHEDLALAEELASRAALAIDNARLHGQAQEAVRAREEVLQIVSHDLRSPASVVRLGSQALLRALSQTSGTEPERRQLEVIQRSAEHMQRLIEDLLQVSQIESETLAVHPQRVRLPALLREVQGLLGPVATEQEIELRADLQTDLPEVWADPERILQVFTNLVQNAIKFTPRGGEVTVTCARAGDDRVRISVADTGRGIPEDEMPHLFDRRWQSKRKRRSGAGLGLAICRGIVVSHKGEIWAENVASGTGAVFHFTLPVAAGEASRTGGDAGRRALAPPRDTDPPPPSSSEIRLLA